MTNIAYYFQQDFKNKEINKSQLLCKRVSGWIPNLNKVEILLLYFYPTTNHFYIYIFGAIIKLSNLIIINLKELYKSSSENLMWINNSRVFLLKLK